MDDVTFPRFAVGTLEPGDWVRLDDGEVGVLHEKVDQPNYQRVRVEVPCMRYPMRFLALDAWVEHITDHQWRRQNTSKRRM